MYKIKEAFYTLQGEGYHSGKAAVFCRFTGCNLWSGLEKDRNRAICQFCDTYFVGTNFAGGGEFKTSEHLAMHIDNLWEPGKNYADKKMVVLTGGEPLLQVDTELIKNLHNLGFYIAVETNGTILAPDGIDWITVSPKAGTELKQTKGDELKLVYPQESAPPEKYDLLNFQYRYLQPMWGQEITENSRMAVAYCKKHPVWKLSTQSQKYAGFQ